jgi:hypothetical protein
LAGVHDKGAAADEFDDLARLFCSLIGSILVMRRRLFGRFEEKFSSL